MDGLRVRDGHVLVNGHDVGLGDVDWHMHWVGLGHRDLLVDWHQIRFGHTDHLGDGVGLRDRHLLVDVDDLRDWHLLVNVLDDRHDVWHRVWLGHRVVLVDGHVLGHRVGLGHGHVVRDGDELGVFFYDVLDGLGLPVVVVVLGFLVVAVVTARVRHCRTCQQQRS